MMKSFIAVFLLLLGSVGLFLLTPLSVVLAQEESATEAVNKLPIGGSSVALVTRAWEALKNDDFESVINLTNECVDRYGKRAQQMQDKLSDYAVGTDAEVRALWALNDVATALFIQGKAFQNAEEYDEAKTAYQRLVEEYTFGQCWDPKGWFWRPAEVAKEHLAMIESGIFFDFGNYTSTELVVRAWEALEKEDLDLVLGYTDKCIKLYGEHARQMQSELTEYPQDSDEEIFSYWALNDVGTAHYIRGKAYLVAGKKVEAQQEFEIVRDTYAYSQCWDPKGWFWKPVTEANNWLKVLSEEAEKEVGSQKI